MYNLVESHHKPSPNANLRLAMQWLLRHNGSSSILRHDVKDKVAPFLVFFIIVAFIGVVSNLMTIYIIARRRLMRNSIFQLVVNLSVVELIRCFVILPLSLMTSFLREWRLGRQFCFIWPVLLPCTIHVTVFGFLSIFVFRFLKVVYNVKSPIPSWTCIVTSWLLSVAILTPHAAFKRYVDLKYVLGPNFSGAGLCVLRRGAEEKNKEYVLSIFFVFYFGIFVIVLTLATLIHSYVKAREQCFPVTMNALSVEMNIRVDEINNTEDNLNYSGAAMLEGHASSMKPNTDVMDTPVRHCITKDDLPIKAIKIKMKEFKNMQNFLHASALSSFLLWLPFYIHFQYEALNGNDEPTCYTLYLCLLFVGYTSSWSLPLAFVVFQLSTETKLRIRHCLNPKAWSKKLYT